jgi:S1-C subfamily serine protease
MNWDEFNRIQMCSLVAWLMLGNLSSSCLADTPAKKTDVESARSTNSAYSSDPLVSLLSQVQPKMVKIYGAGGMRGLESYQSGFLISPEGHIATSWSTVLDSTKIRVILADGFKTNAEMVGMDPQTEIAVLKIQESTKSFFAVDAAALPRPWRSRFGGGSAHP